MNKGILRGKELQVYQNAYNYVAEHADELKLSPDFREIHSAIMALLPVYLHAMGASVLIGRRVMAETVLGQSVYE